MRLITLIYIMLIISGCTGTKFTYMSDGLVSNLGPSKDFKIDNTYELFVRQISRVYNPVTKTYSPTNSDPNDPNDIVELEYMLLSKEKKQVIIINNIPSIYKSSHGEKSKSFNLATRSNEIEIDVWYLKQFRFGKFESNSKLEFSNADGGTKTHIWNLENVEAGIMKVNSISVMDRFGAEVKNIDEAFELPILFKKVNVFKLVFKNKTKVAKSLFEVKDQTIHVAKSDGKWYIIFKFDNPVNGGKLNNIVFTKDRMYAPPSD